MKKKIIAIIMALAVSFTMVSSAFAADESLPVRLTEKQILAEIQSEEARIFDEVYMQLKAQGALGLMDIYKEILKPEIEQSVRQQYGVNLPALQSTTSSFTYGGTVAYKQSGATVLNTYLDYDNSYYYVLSMDSSTVGSIVQQILGYIPKWGTVFSGLFSINSIYSASAKKSIRDAGGYAMIMNVDSAVEKGSVVIGWKNHPKVVCPSGCKTKKFAKHNPFN